MPIDEGTPRALNPYGCRAIHGEDSLSYDTRTACDSSRCDTSTRGGATKRKAHHEPETHLIPNVLAAAAGRRPFVSVFGDSYPTPDGTCVRDYIHVTDLCTAHTLALEHLRRGGSSEFINLGNGHGYSVMEVIETARVTGREIEVRVEPARPATLRGSLADATKAREVLGWKTQYPELEAIVRTAWGGTRRTPKATARTPGDRG